MTERAGADLREEVQARYALAARAVLDPKPGVSASCCGTSDSGTRRGTGSAALDTADAFGGRFNVEGETDGLPEAAVLASLGCGNPFAVADLRQGERVLDLGSGGGIDVLLSARRVGPTGYVYGIDMADDMLTLAQANAAKGRHRQRRVHQGSHRGRPAARVQCRRGDLQLRDQPVHGQAGRAGRDVPRPSTGRPARHHRRRRRGSADCS